MAEFKIRPDLLARLEETARDEHRAVDEILEDMLRQRETSSPDDLTPLHKMLAVIEADTTVTWRGESDASERTREAFAEAYEELTRQRVAQHDSNSD